MCGETNLRYSLVITFPTWIFVSHVRFLIMNVQLSLSVCLIFALVTSKLHGCKYLSLVTSDYVPVVNDSILLTVVNIINCVKYLNVNSNHIKKNPWL